MYTLRLMIRQILTIYRLAMYWLINFTCGTSLYSLTLISDFDSLIII